MLYLLATILCSSAIMILFKIFIRYRIDYFQAIIINYIFALSMGLITSPVKLTAASGAMSWLPLAILLGVMFFSTLLLYASSTKNAGVAITTICSRTSLIIPVAASFLFFGESTTTLKIIAIALVLCALVLIFMQDGKAQEESHSSRKKIVVPMAVFLSTAFVDTGLKAAQFSLIHSADEYSLFVSAIFCTSLIFGISVLLFTGRLKGTKLSWKNLFGGLCLGFVNYYTSYSLLHALDQMDATIVYPIMYTSIVLITTITGVYIFGEKLTSRKVIGIAIAVSAIVLLTI